MDEMFSMKRRFNAGTTLSEESSDDESGYNGAPPAKKPYEGYSAISLRMMESMGHKSGTGLGKAGQGRLEPIEASAQKGRRGFGLKLDGLDLAAQKWTPEMENIQMRETAEFISDYSDDLITKSLDELKETWMVEGPKKMTIEDETNFCHPDVLRNVLAQKSVFDNLGADDMRNARTRSNPFETIGSAIFLNRAAVKMANMDALFDFMFTEPVDEDGTPLVKENELLYFADVCAGPGGFSEYVLWRKQWHAKGFGFTLQCENDFKLDKFLAGHPETFDTYYGIKGDGNVYDPDNIESLTDYILKQTTVGVHFMMSDGGFSVEGQENEQEILSKQLYLCQCLTALSIVRVDGHFVTKLFDLFTPFSVGLIYLMYKCFKQISIVKPNTSRPANSERYLVCKWKKSNTDAIRQYLFDVNVHLYDNCNTDSDITELVPLEVMQNDENFFNYICKSNNIIGENQVVALLKIAHYSKDPTLKEARQEEFKKDSLDIWRVPNKMRTAPQKPSTEQLFKTLLDLPNGHGKSNNWFAIRDQIFNTHDRPLKPKLDFFDKTDWAFVPIDVTENTGKTIRTFFMSKGNADVFKYTDNHQWVPLTEVFVEITPNTLFYGEIVKELTGEGAAQTMVYAMHIIDGIVLGGMDIRNFNLEKRNRLCRKFADALNKPQKVIGTNSDRMQCTASIRCKTLYQLLDLGRFFGALSSYRLKDNKQRLGLLVRDIMNPKRFYVPRGILIFKILKPNLCKRFDPKYQEYFYTDIPAKKDFRLKDCPDPDSIYGSFRSTFQHRKIWKWEHPLQVNENREIVAKNRMEGLLYRIDFEDFLYN